MPRFALPSTTSDAADMAGLTSLPTETICSIAGKLDQADLLSLSLVCRHVSGPAIRQLYVHPRVGSWQSGERFRAVLSSDRETIDSQLVSLACADWLGWHGWFAELEPLPALREASVDCGPDTSSWWYQNGVIASPLRLAWILRAMSIHSGLRSLSIVGPTVLYSPLNDPELPLRGPLLHLTDLSLHAVCLAGISSLPLHPFLICPNVRRLSLELEELTLDAGGETSMFHYGTVDFLASFVSLRSLSLAGAVMRLDGVGFREVLPRLRELSLRLSGDFEGEAWQPEDDDDDLPLYRPLPLCLFDSTFANLESLWLNATWGSPQAFRLLAVRLASRTSFPSLRRFKTTLPEPPDPMTVSFARFVTDAFGQGAVTLRQAGFICHLCPVNLYAERPSATRSVQDCEQGHKPEHALDDEVCCKC